MGHGLCRRAHDSGSRLSRFAAIAHSCQPFSGCPRFRVCTVAADWRCIRHRSRVDHLALRSGGSFARNQSLDERPGFTAAEVADRAAGRTFAGVAGRSRLAHAEPAQPQHQDFGIATANRYVVHFDPAGAGYTVSTIPALNDRLERKFSALPGVKSIGLALYSTLEGDNWGEGVSVEGRPEPGPGEHNVSSWDRVSPRFFETIGQAVVRGRGFTDQDTATSRLVSVVNKAFVKKFFPNEDPIGHHFGTNGPGSSTSYEIVGVVADAKYNNPREPVHPMYFRPMTQMNTTLKDRSAITGESRSLFPNSITILFAGDAAGLEPVVRHTLANINPNLTVLDFKSLDYQVAGNFNQERLITRLTTLFGLLALVLASVGLYGITAYSVARRTSEIGLRMALGANRGDVVALVLRGASLQVGIGLVIGIPVALLGGHFMASQLYGVRTYDPLTLAGAVTVLSAFAEIAGFIPARQAASIEPMNALRTE